ncbi:MBL fold metallo-hydrolase [Exiguobacterium sp. AM39-5BH]|uniref:MBL fold metallo-hydrolase n=1 Tax=Exiguobacterium sp. AM39-5BH TaxID=2292355 RepID=UPI002100EE84|nr:MBL fold metallo-hydrolase [Exiguobacterium sp. AM39-5BH]
MKVTRIDHVHQLTFYAPILPINVQLIERELGLTLIDTALERNAEAILAYIESLERPLLAILLTHAHGDHVGGVDMILKPILMPSCMSRGATPVSLKGTGRQTRTSGLSN